MQDIMNVGLISMSVLQKLCFLTSWEMPQLLKQARVLIGLRIKRLLPTCYCCIQQCLLDSLRSHGGYILTPDIVAFVKSTSIEEGDQGGFGVLSSWTLSKLRYPWTSVIRIITEDTKLFFLYKHIHKCLARSAFYQSLAYKVFPHDYF